MTALVSHLKLLEDESIHIFREAAAQFRAPVLLYSIGKDSTVLLHLARKAFYPAKLPFPLLHVDTTWKFHDMIAFRDRTVKELGLDLIVHTNHEGLARNINPFDNPPSVYTDVMKTVALRQALDAGDSMQPLAALAATRRQAAPRSACFLSAPRVIAGIRVCSALNCGRCSMAASARARPSASSRSRIGRKAMSGATSRWRSLTSCRFILPRSGPW